MRVFFDTNVLVYSIDREYPAKCAAALTLLERHARERTLVLSTQVLQEFYAVSLRRRLLAPPDALGMIRRLAAGEVVGSSAEFVVRALELGHRERLAAWDALVLQAALDAGCSTLLSEDFQHGRRYGALEVIDPFRGSAHEPAPAGTAARAAPRRSRPTTSSPPSRSSPAPVRRR